MCHRTLFFVFVSHVVQVGRYADLAEDSLRACRDPALDTARWDVTTWPFDATPRSPFDVRSVTLRVSACSIPAAATQSGCESSTFPPSISAQE